MHANAHLQDCSQFYFSQVQTIYISTVDYVYDSIYRLSASTPRTCVMEVTSPIGTNTGLTAQIPHLERDILIFQGLHIETDSRHGRHDLV